MARIKKKGLDYFPLNTDFIHDRAVRRLMKREGDSALGVLVEILSYIYAGEGYYVRADRLFYEDLSAGLYEKSADDVERIVRLAVEYGLFDAVLFERSCILTSVEIQRQYLFSTRRRSISHLEVGYCLLADDEPADNKDDAKGTPAVKSEKQGHGEGITRGDNVTFIPENVTSGTHSTSEHSVAQQSKAQPHFNSPLKTAGEKAERKKIGAEEISSGSSCGRDVSGSGKRKKWTQESAYAYDANGNLTKDLNKNIVDIQYNSLNLPSRIVFKNGDDISHVYSADGSKLRTVRVADGDTLTTDYCGNMIYENGVPVRLMTDVGKVEWSGSSVRRLLFREPLWILWK